MHPNTFLTLYSELDFLGEIPLDDPVKAQELIKSAGMKVIPAKKFFETIGSHLERARVREVDDPLAYAVITYEQKMREILTPPTVGIEVIKNSLGYTA